MFSGSLEQLNAPIRGLELRFMGEINTGNSISLASDWEPAAMGTESQLANLSSVLNGLNRGATVMQSQMDAASGAVKSGTYRVDPLQLSQRIVRDACGQSNAIWSLRRT